MFLLYAILYVFATLLHLVLLSPTFLLYYSFTMYIFSFQLYFICKRFVYSSNNGSLWWCFVYKQTIPILNSLQVNGFECMCPLGYQGTFCEDKKTECSAGKCQNGGKCSETPDGFTCSCSAGFTGLYCEATINVSIEYSAAFCVLMNRTLHFEVAFF